MLVLTRKSEESIIVVSPRGEVMEIHLSKIDNDRAKVGIEAPMTFKIFRKEIYETIQKNLEEKSTFETPSNMKLFRNFASSPNAKEHL